MRILLATLCLTVAGTACADRLISVPTARKLPFRNLRLEFMTEQGSRADMEYGLAVGASTNVELELRGYRFGAGNHFGTVDLGYNFMSPITNLSPGFAVGVQDVLNRTPNGWRAYAVATFREGLYVIGGELPADLTLGLGFSNNSAHLLIGASIPFSREVRFMAEHDGRQLGAGFEVKPVPALGLRFVVQPARTLLGLTYQARF